MTSFEDAARRMLGAPPEAVISSDWEEGGYMNTGCDTCGYSRDESKITIYAYLYYRTPSGRLNPNKNQSWSREFTDLPSLWEALFTDDETDTP